MFSPVTMQRLSVVVLERDERTVLRGLGQMGAVHLVRTEAGPDTAPQEPPDRSPELSHCDNLLGRVGAIQRRLGLEVLPPPREDLEEVGLDEAERRLVAIEKRVNELVDRRASTQEQWGRLTGILEQVSAYEGIEIPLDQLGQFTFLHFALGSLPEENIEDLRRQVGKNVVLVPLGEGKEKRRLAAITSRKGRFALETALQGAGFEREQLQEPVTGGVADKARQEQKRLADELLRLGHAVEALAVEVAQPLADLGRVVRIERQILEAEQNFPHTSATVLVTGWVPAEDVPLVRRRLHEITDARCVIKTARADGVPEAEIPVLLRHPRLLRPFEMLVAGYGLPGYRELEPTLFVAITFIGMFGMMFGDVGHGALLVVGGLIAMRVGRSQNASDMGVLLAMAGAGSILFGFVYGEYFGIEGWALWHSPLKAESTMAFLAVAVLIGMGIITLGFILNVVSRLRRGDWIGGILDRFGVVGGLLYWAAVALVIRWAVLDRKELNWVLGLVIAAALVALLVREPILYAIYRRRGRHTEATSLLEAILSAFIEVYETVIQYTANTISFVRLGAYAMTHAAILFSTFVLADEVARATGPGLGGGTLRVVVIVIGNVLAIFLEGIIASAQALRLEYYEFFGKFLSGGGRAFKPFRLSAKDGPSAP